jgi:hypothetical protein
MNEVVPDDCMLNVFRYFTASQLCLVSLVCRRWAQLSGDDCLWRGLLLFYFSLDSEGLEFWSTFAMYDSERWKTMFKGKRPTIFF